MSENEQLPEASTETDSTSAIPPPEKKRRKFRFGRFLLILFVLFVTAISASFVQFLVTRQTAWDFIPKNFQLYLQVPSISTVYDKWANLDALQLAFAEDPKLAGLQKSLLSLKSSGLAMSPWFRALVDVQVHLVLKENQEAIVVFDLGWRSMVTRWLPLASGLIRVDGLSVIQKNGRTIFRYELSKQSAAYISFVDNLALVAFSQESLESLFALHTDGESLADTKKTPIREEFATSNSGSLRLLAEPRSVVSTLISDLPTRQRIDQLINWKDAALVSMNVDNTSLTLNAATIVDSSRPDIAAVLTRKNPVLSALRYLPSSTYFYSAVSLGDFRALLRIWTAFSGQSLDDTLRVAEEGAHTIFGTSLEELLWSWMGEEAGMFYVADNGDPIFHVSIKDEGKRQSIFQKLSSSIVINVDNSLVLDGVPVSKLVLPTFTKILLSVFNISFDTPYYIVRGNQLFLSMNPENLSRIANGIRDNALLYKSPEFESMMNNTPKNPVLFVYYNLDKSVPFFLKGNNLLAKSLKLYNRGALSLFINDGRVSLSLNAARLAVKRTIGYPGFPISVEGGIKRSPWIGFLPGRSDPVIAVIRNGNELNLESIAGAETIMSYPVEPDTVVLPLQWGGDLLAWSPTGTIYRFDVKGNAVSPFPVMSPSQGSFVPVGTDRKLFLFNRAEQSLFTVDQDGSVAKLPLELDAPVLSAPDLGDGLMAVASKTFEGTVYLSDEAGRVQTGWPQEGGGIGLSGARIFQTPAGKRIVFLTQGGILNVWRPDGTQENGFPVKLGSVFSAAPQYIRSPTTPCIAVVDQAGLLTLVGMDGKILRNLKLRGDGTESVISAYDIDGDGTDEIFVSGGRNSVDGFDLMLTMLKGFPVTGSFKPQFMDLNLDGKAEMVVASYDGHIYAYTLSQ